MKPAVVKIHWLIKLGSKEFSLSESEYTFLKKADNEGKTKVWFKDEMISIPHISYAEKITEVITPPMEEIIELSPEEREKARKRVEEIKKTLKEKLSLKSTLSKDKEQERKNELRKQAEILSTSS